MTDRHEAPSGAPAPEGASGAPAPLPAAARNRRGIVGEYVFASVCAALGLYAIIGAGFIRVPPGSASVLGPRFFPYFVGAILLAIIIANIVVRDGESNWFEGLQLLALYVILGLAFFYA